jgi:hypothetical protein
MPKKAMKARIFENRPMTLTEARDHLSEALENEGKEDMVRECAVDVLAVLSAIDDTAQKVKLIRRKLPRDPEKQNHDRAVWAGIALGHFQNKTGTDDEDSLSDLLCDLMHLCDRRAKAAGFDFDRELDRARGHYQAETEGDELTP